MPEILVPCHNILLRILGNPMLILAAQSKLLSAYRLHVLKNRPCLLIWSIRIRIYKERGLATVNLVFYAWAMQLAVGV